MTGTDPLGAATLGRHVGTWAGGQLVRRALLSAALVLLGVPIGLALTGIALLVAYTPAEPEPPELPGRALRTELEHGGHPRSWTLYRPATLSKHPALLLVLHGSGQNAEQTRQLTLWRFDELAERDRFLVVYPEGLANSSAGGTGPEWNDCRKSTRNRAHDLNVDDVGFLERVVAQVVDSHDVDTARIYATGISDGGQMSYRLATELPDRFAAVAILVAQQAEPENSNCLRPRGPISVLVMNGTADPIVPYEGGVASLYGWFSAGRVQSMEGTLAHWRRVNGLDGPGRRQRLPDLDPNDGSTVERVSWIGSSGHEVVGYSIHGGGHTVPGGWQYFDKIGIGRTNRDIVAADVIWHFFRRHTLGERPRRP